MDSAYRLMMFFRWYMCEFAPRFWSPECLKGNELDLRHKETPVALHQLQTLPHPLSVDDINTALIDAYERIAAIERKLQVLQCNVSRLEKRLIQ